MWQVLIGPYWSSLIPTTSGTGWHNMKYVSVIPNVACHNSSPFFSLNGACIQTIGNICNLLKWILPET